MRHKCKSCGASRGFIVVQPITGSCNTKYDSFDQSYADDQASDMYDIKHGKMKKKLICAVCGKYYGHIKEVGFNDKT
jgi:ribosomal protein S14